MRAVLPEQWPPFGMAIPFTFHADQIRFDAINVFRSSKSFDQCVRTTFRDAHGNEYVHIKRYELDLSVREVIYRHRLWLRGQEPG